MKCSSSSWCVGLVVLWSVFVVGGDGGSHAIRRAFAGETLDVSSVPSQPGEESWQFVKELQSPLWTKHAWEKRSPGPEQADLSRGVHIRRSFPDPGGRLDTAYEDLRCFFAAADLASDRGDYVIETAVTAGLPNESFRLEVAPERCRVLATDVEGVRRGIFHLEDQMLRQRGPFLPLGTLARTPAVRRRISRCVYGPIKRPPAMRDELMDDVDYYPDQYLNRLAHEGVNGLWLSVDFRDLAATKFTPAAGKDSARRLAKLKRTVAQNLRFGIRTFLFTIEPRAWGNRSPYYQDIHVLDSHPELGGARVGDMAYFCPMSDTARDYLYQVVNTIFREAPGLGGIINITHGERATTCASALAAAGGGSITCPRCSGKAPWEILHASLSAMERGMHDVAPDAEFISWHYMGTAREYPDWVYEIPAHTPKGIILQFQFETGVTKTEFGKRLVGGDYWLATPGPSQRFERQAEMARRHGTLVSAKIQTGNSHEVASIPYVPAPSLIHRKFSAMQRLGVSHTMLGWYFGNYPGLMIKSAGELSFEPFPESEVAFLTQLASLYWKKEDVAAVVEAYQRFAEGYGNYPLQAMFGYYGPMHDGPVWPLLLKPCDAPLSPTWQVGSSTTLKPWPPSGDRIGECLWGGTDRIGESLDHVLNLKETVELCRRMSAAWDQGVSILKRLEPKYEQERERLLDVGLARALGIQFRSGYNILRFYELREDMLRGDGKERLAMLRRLAGIVRDELELDQELLELCARDSRLGFHSEAEGYKYFPEKIRWRMRQLREVLTNDVPELERQINNDQLLFPEYTGRSPQGAVARAVRSAGFPESDALGGLEWQACGEGAANSAIRWAATYDADALYIIVADTALSNPSSSEPTIAGVTVRIEPRRLWPCARYAFALDEHGQMGEGTRVVRESGQWRVVLRVPLRGFWWRDEETHPLRIDVRVQKRGVGTCSWRPSHPITSRLVFGAENHADLGWLILK